MSKKYIPSGYQIINLDLEVEQSGISELKTPETEDEKILHSLLSDAENIKKPILIKAKVYDKDSDTIGYFKQFATIIDNTLLLGFSNNYSSLEIYADDDKLSITFTIV